MNIGIQLEGGKMEGYLSSAHYVQQCVGIDAATGMDRYEEAKISKGTFYFDDDTVVVEYNHKDDSYSVLSARGYIYDIDCLGDDPCDIRFSKVDLEDEDDDR